MIIYEVNISIPNSLYNKYIKWLNNHMQKMLTLSGFLECKKYEIEKNDKSNRYLSIHYHIDSLNSFENYLSHSSKIMQNEGLELFTNNILIDRRVLRLKK